LLKGKHLQVTGLSCLILRWENSPPAKHCELAAAAAPSSSMMDPHCLLHFFVCFGYVLLLLLRPMRRLLNLMHVCLHKPKPYWIDAGNMQRSSLQREACNAASSMYGHVRLPSNDEQTSMLLLVCCINFNEPHELARRNWMLTWFSALGKEPCELGKVQGNG